MQPLAALGNLCTASLLLTIDLIHSAIRGALLFAVDLIDVATGSGKNTGRKKLGWHEQRYATSPVFSDEGGYEALDSAATLATSTFPIGPEELIAKAKRVLAAEFGTIVLTHVR